MSARSAGAQAVRRRPRAPGRRTTYASRPAPATRPTPPGHRSRARPRRRRGRSREAPGEAERRRHLLVGDREQPVALLEAELRPRVIGSRDRSDEQHPLRVLRAVEERSVAGRRRRARSRSIDPAAVEHRHALVPSQRNRQPRRQVDHGHGGVERDQCDGGRQGAHVRSRRPALTQVTSQRQRQPAPAADAGSPPGRQGSGDL